MTHKTTKLQPPPRPSRRRHRGKQPHQNPQVRARRDAAAYQARYFAFDGVKGRQGLRDR